MARNCLSLAKKFSIRIPLDQTIGLGRDHRGFAGSGQRLEHPLVGIERLVGDQRFGGHAWEQCVGAGQVMRLSAGQEEADRIAERVDQGVYLGAQSAARVPDRLVLAGFFLAPALC